MRLPAKTDTLFLNVQTHEKTTVLTGFFSRSQKKTCAALSCIWTHKTSTYSL